MIGQALAPRLEDRVLAGETWLNANAPADWWTEKRTDLERLNLMDCTDCTLGQLTGHYGHVAPHPHCVSFHLLELPRIALPRLTLEEAIRYGFALPPGSRAVYPALTATWRALILARREAAKEADNAPTPSLMEVHA